MQGHKPNISKHEAGLQCRRLPKHRKVKKKEQKNLCILGCSQQPLCHRNRFARLTAQEHCRHTSGCRTCAEQTHPAIQEANSWCSQHINIVAVEMLRIQQPSKNYFTKFLRQLNSLFLNSLHAPCNSTPPACQISTI